ncbi:MAG: hypothetical protein KGL35_25935 [Bradyrhizobium sp.]|nr:hypothetical protein [Bradyrhizobium sp.]
MADTPEDDDLELEIVAASAAEFVDLPDGGSFVFPHGAAEFAKRLDCAAARVWGNGDVSILPNPPADAPASTKWRRIKHSPLTEVSK